MASRGSPVVFRPTSGRLLSTQRAWEAFVSGREPDVRQVPPVILESWQRSRAQGIDPALAQAPFESLPQDREELRTQVSWLSAAEPVFDFLQSAFSEAHQLLLLRDASGRILLSHGGKRALARAEELNAIAGGKWSEKDVGCTAIGATLHTGSPARVSWFQTYCQNWHDWVNQAAPIHDPITRELVGALNIAGFREVSHRSALNLLVQAVSLIQMTMLERESLLRMLVLDRFMSHSSRYHSDGMIALDRKGYVLGYVLALNSAAERQLSLRRDAIVGQKINQIRPLVELLPPGGNVLLNISSGQAEQRIVNGTVIIPVYETQLAGYLLILPSRGSRPEATWKTSHSFSDLVGKSPLFAECLHLASNASEQDWPLLLLGESGTGKELFAHAVHNAGPRRTGPFVAFSCAGVSDELVSAELFGYTEGSYTGAAKGGRIGKIQLADKGTLFLDDIDSMPLRMQAALLRVIEDQRVLPIGATKPESVDVRIVAASNRDLEKASQEGSFRADLFYRLSVLTITLPPLRRRTGDIPLLSEHLISQYAPGKSIEEEALQLLAGHSWPGNVRELRNVLVRASARAKSGLITSEDISLKTEGSERDFSQDLVRPLKATERDQIMQALKASETVLEAANMLGIHFTTLYRKMRRYGLSK